MKEFIRSTPRPGLQILIGIMSPVARQAIADFQDAIMPLQHVGRLDDSPTNP